VTSKQRRLICEAKRAREKAVARGDMRKVHELNAVIARARR
jgi:hypothetical protein